MEDKTKTIGASVLALIVGALAMLGGVQLTDDDIYYCADRNIVMQCDEVTQYVLPNGKCWNEPVGNKICKTGDGWVKVVNDFYAEPEPIKSIGGRGHQEMCDINGCTPIN